MAEMTANLKAPLVINTREKTAKQVVLQENDQPIKHPMFKKLRTHLIGLSSDKNHRKAGCFYGSETTSRHARVELI